MLSSIRLLATCLLVAISLFACIDHRLGGPASPAQLRLRSVQSTAQNSALNYTYTYSYDTQNRVIKIDRLRGGVAGQSLVSYGDPQRNNVDPSGSSDYTFYTDYPNTATPSNVTITRFPLVLDGSNFTAQKFGTFLGLGPSPKLILNTQNVIMSYDYAFDATKHIKSMQTAGPSGPGDFNSFRYTYTGDNITSQILIAAAGHGGMYTTTYTYDDKLNPFWDLLDPAIDILLRFNRANALAMTNLSDRSVTTYTYEYNAQGLPTKRTTAYNGTVTETLIYTYENY